MLPSPPRARRRVGGPAEAYDGRGSAEAFGGGSSEASGEGASSDTENWPRPAVVSWFRSLRSLSNRHFFLFLLRVPLLTVSDSSPRALGGVEALPLRF